MVIKNVLLAQYGELLKKYGQQGWWPLLELHKTRKGVQPTKSGSVHGYHPGDYSYPKTERQRFEICIGAILTQNTAWPNVERALLNLDSLNALEPKKLLALDEAALKDAIRPAGYFNQKSRKIRIFAEFYLSLKGRSPTRIELLNLWGVGPETADSILLYAYQVPLFVVDAYTQRAFPQFMNDAYEDIQEKFHASLKRDFKLFQEYHALLVENGKCLKPGKKSRPKPIKLNKRSRRA